MPKSNIALIGFMATGKTTVGKALVEYLGSSYSFIETDQIIIENVGKGSCIWSRQGCEIGGRGVVDVGLIGNIRVY